MRAEKLRSEAERMQWMSEMRMQMATQQADTTDPETVIQSRKSEPIQLNLVEENLVSAVNTICKRFLETPEGQKAKLNFRSMADEMIVRFDKDQVTRAMNILLGNAVRFSPGNCRISVNLGRSDDNKAVIQVADNGIGIRDEFKATLFEPMVGSEGIGLDKVKNIVDAHGGSIRVEDNPGGGTFFVILLPIAPEGVVEDAVMMDDEN